MMTHHIRNAHRMLQRGKSDSILMRIGPSDRTELSRLIPLLLITVLIVVSAAGCSRREPVAQVDFEKESHSFYVVYLTGDIFQARNSLLKSIALIEKTKLGPNANAYCLLFNYIRLYFIEKKAGDLEMAEAYRIKARYWDLQYCELQGIYWDLKGVSLQRRAAQLVITHTGEIYLESVDKWDKQHNGGKSARYSVAAE